MNLLNSNAYLLVLGRHRALLQARRAPRNHVELGNGELVVLLEDHLIIGHHGVGARGATGLTHDRASSRVYRSVGGGDGEPHTSADRQHCKARDHHP